MTKTFAVYKGDDLLTSGTAKQCASALNIKVGTVYFYKSRTHQKRSKSNNTRVSVELQEGDDTE